jgi:uncharacterized membrane protein
MLFFALLAVLTAAITLIERGADWPRRMRLALAIALVAVGTDHWANRERYLAMMPPWVPLHYFVAVFPANIHNALNGLAVEGLPQAAWYYWARLPFQPLAIWWALFSTGLIRWPLRAREAT